MTKHVRFCVSVCRDVGLTPRGIEWRGKHFAVSCEEGLLFCPCTPSDRRFHHNLRSSARRLLRRGLA
jgi:hypothetical protein